MEETKEDRKKGYKKDSKKRNVTEVKDQEQSSEQPTKEKS